MDTQRKDTSSYWSCRSDTRGLRHMAHADDTNLIQEVKSKSSVGSNVNEVDTANVGSQESPTQGSVSSSISQCEDNGIKTSFRVVREGISRKGSADPIPVKEFLVTIENLHILPPSGKLDISIEFPCACSSMKAGQYQTTTMVNSRSFSSFDLNENNIPKKKNENGDQTLARCRSRTWKTKQDMQYLHVEETQKRSMSDSNLSRNRSKSPVRINLPEIRVEDFSNQRTPLKRNLTDHAIRFSPHNQSKGNDVADNFPADINVMRNRSFTCPEGFLKPSIKIKRPITTSAGSSSDSTMIKELNRKHSQDRSLFKKTLSQVEEDLF